MSTKRLFLVMTHYQLIMALHLALTMGQDESKNTDILITDHSRGAAEIAHRIQSLGIFGRVQCIAYKKADKEIKRPQKISEVIKLNLARKNIYTDLFMPYAEAYQEIWFYNNSLLLYAIYDACQSNHQKVKLIRFEEGVFSYNDHSKEYGTGILKLNYFLRKALRKKDTLSEVAEYHCLYPDLYINDRNYSVKAIPRIERSNADFLKLLNTAFAYQPTEFHYDKKYIYFASAEDLNRPPVGEIRVIQEVINQLGKDNIILKMHPRDHRTIFEDMGIAISRDSHVPWEVVQLNQDFHNHVFITLASGSIVGATAMLQDDMEGYLLYPMVQGRNPKFDNYCRKSVGQILVKLQKQGICMRYKVLDGVSEIK